MQYLSTPAEASEADVGLEGHGLTTSVQFSPQSSPVSSFALEDTINNSTSKSFSTTGSAICVICFAAPAVAKTVPCDHSVFCSLCLAKTLRGPPAERRCPICRTHVTAAFLKQRPYTQIAISSGKMVRQKTVPETSMRNVRQAWPSWFQSDLTPTVLVIGMSAKLVQSFMRTLRSSLPENPSANSRPTSDVAHLYGLQYMPLVAGNSTGFLDPGTYSMIRQVQPSAVVLLSDRQNVGTFHRMVNCDFGLIEQLPRFLTRNIIWVLLDHSFAGQSRKKVILRQASRQSSHAVDAVDVNSAMHYIGTHRISQSIHVDARTGLAEAKQVSSTLRQLLLETSSLDSLVTAPDDETNISSIGSDTTPSGDRAAPSRVRPFSRPTRSGTELAPRRRKSSTRETEKRGGILGCMCLSSSAPRKSSPQ